MTADADERTLAGDVEVYGAYFVGYVKPANEKENRVNRRKAEHQSGKRKVVVVMRERGGETLPFVFKAKPPPSRRSAARSRADDRLQPQRRPAARAQREL